MEVNNISSILCLDLNTNCEGFRLQTTTSSDVLACFANCLYNIFCIFYVFIKKKEECYLYSIVHNRYYDFNSVLGDISCGNTNLKNGRLYYSEIFMYLNTSEFIGILIFQLICYTYMTYFSFRIKNVEHKQIIYPSEYIAIILDVFRNSILMYEYEIIIIYDSYENYYIFIVWTIMLITVVLHRLGIICKRYYSISDRIQRKIYLNYDLIIWFLSCFFGISLIKIGIMGVEHNRKKNIFFHNFLAYLIFLSLDIISLVLLPFVFHFIRFLPLIIDLALLIYNLIFYLLILFFNLYDDDIDIDIIDNDSDAKTSNNVTLFMSTHSNDD